MTKITIFKIKKIEVTGNQKITKEEILKKAEYREGYNIYKFKKSTSLNNIKSIPYVESADIDIKLPNIVKIKVKEKKPIAMIAYNDELLLIDISGSFLETKKREEGINLPEISGLDIRNKSKIFQGKYSSEQIEFIKLCHEKKYLNKMKYINFSNMDNIVVELNSKEKVHFGNINNLDYKLDFLDEILKDTKRKKISVKRIELNKGNNPIVITNEDISTNKEGAKTRD